MKDNSYWGDQYSFVRQDSILMIISAAADIGCKPKRCLLGIAWNKNSAGSGYGGYFN